MSNEQTNYSPGYIQFWTILSIVLGLLLLVMFVCGDALLSFGHVVWILLRWLATPII